MEEREAAPQNGSTPASPAFLKLDGREFEGISQALTATQDDYIIGHLRRAGAIEVLSDLDVVKPRADAERAEDLLTRIFISGRKHFILAGCLTERGKRWSREEAERNAQIFSQITDKDEKAVMSAAVVRFVAGFFLSGEPSSPNSPKSSSRTAKGRRTASAAGGTSGTSLQ